MSGVNSRVNSISKIKIVVAIFVGVTLLALLVVIFTFPLVFEKPYYVVYAANGEIYVGQASWAPRFHLTDTYILQATNPSDLSATSAGSEQATPGINFQMVPLSSTPWAPKKVYFERHQVIFYGPVDEKSSVAATLQNR